MKNYNKFIGIFTGIIFIISMQSCKKFLEEISQDEIKPTTITDLRELMNGAAYPYLIHGDPYVDLLTDDIQSNGLAVNNGTVIAAYQTPYDNGLPVFEWNPLMFDGDLPFPTVSNSWKIYYEKIKGCNVILDHLDKVSGTVAQKANVEGQVLFLRSYYYLRLVNLYAQPFSKAGVDMSSSPGVPLILSSAVSDELPSRNSVGEVYAQIETDLLKAANLLETYPEEFSPFRVNQVTTWALLSRMYLYRGLNEEDWTNAITYANKSLEVRGTLSKLSSQITATSTITHLAIYDAMNSQEVLWVYGAKSTNNVSYFPLLNSNGKAPYSASSALTGLYEPSTGTSSLGDLRYTLYFNAGLGTPAYRYYSNKAPTSTQYGPRGIRVAEVYLNRAEAALRRYVQSGNESDKTLALADLNYLRESRYDVRNTRPTIDATLDGASLLALCLQERRKELCLENGSRWTDIRRLGIEVTHISVQADGSSKELILPADAALHALPIPYDVLLANSNLSQNPR